MTLPLARGVARDAATCIAAALPVVRGGAGRGAGHTGRPAMPVPHVTMHFHTAGMRRSSTALLHKVLASVLVVDPVQVEGARADVVHAPQRRVVGLPVRLLAYLHRFGKLTRRRCSPGSQSVVQAYRLGDAREREVGIGLLNSAQAVPAQIAKQCRVSDPPRATRHSAAVGRARFTSTPALAQTHMVAIAPDPYENTPTLRPGKVVCFA